MTHVVFGRVRADGGALTVEDAPYAVDLRVLDVRVLDGRIVILHEHLLEELDGERRLADAPVADDHQFIRAHVLVRWLRHCQRVERERKFAT